MAAVPPAKEKEVDHNASTLDIPTVIYDKHSGQTYTRGKLLGKGGFARCYEVTNAKTNEVLACKIVNKSLLLKPHQREKMSQEIRIHRDLRHEFVVNFLSYFEDDANVYITLELCSKKSLMELQKRRRMLTEPEAKYFMRQICCAVKYLHEDKHIIHRDLKLGNIFVSENNNSLFLKIGDFGLATQIEFDGERKKTLCGTPNYIAPEVLGKKGHSYEVDIWSIGCILYTLLVGRPPFETATLRDTYHRIKRGEYFIPSNVKISNPAKTLLHKLLQVNPTSRPSAREILASDFMCSGLIPSKLPPSVLTMAPRFERPKVSSTPAAAGSAYQFGMNQLPTKSVNAKELVGAPPMFKKPLTESNAPRTSIPLSGDLRAQLPPRARSNTPMNTSQDAIEGVGDLNNGDIADHMKSLRDQIKKIVDINPRRLVDDDDSEDPSQCPLIWICKWVDYSDKYGFGYHLSDDSIGVSFNDQTKIILMADGSSMHYIEKSGHEHYHSLEKYPDELQKKVKLLKYFQQYMQDNLMKATGGRDPPNAAECISRVPNMWTWFRTSRAVVMILSNGTLQINNFRDHSKMILCPLLGALTTLGANKSMRTYKLASMEKGLTQEMYDRLKYTLEKVTIILERDVPEIEA